MEKKKRVGARSSGGITSCITQWWRKRTYLEHGIDEQITGNCRDLVSVSERGMQKAIMDASSSSSWTHDRDVVSLPSPQAPQQSQNRSHQQLYNASNLAPLPPVTAPMSSQLGKRELCACDTYCQSLQQTIEPEFQCATDPHRPEDPLQQHSVSSSHCTGQGEAKDLISARKIHKADREKLRRDRLNEHFVELAGALEPERPKNDKATILGDAIQMVRELNAEVKRLRTEHSSFLDESQDLVQEKDELSDEKALLKSEVDQLRGQLQQRMQTMFSWMTMNPSIMMGGAVFPYAVPVPLPGSNSVADPHHASTQGQIQQPFVPPNQYIPFPAPSAFPLHPTLQSYYRIDDRSNPFPLHSNNATQAHAHIERPCAQYPMPIQPLASYSLQNRSTQARPPTPSLAQGASCPRPHPPATPFLSSLVQVQNAGSQHDDCSVGNLSQTLNSEFRRTQGHPSSRPLHQDIPESHEDLHHHVQTTLQLQTPSPYASPPHCAQLSQASSKLCQTQAQSCIPKPRRKESSSQQGNMYSLHLTLHSNFSPKSISTSSKEDGVEQNDDSS